MSDVSIATGLIGLGYTIATGQLFCEFDDLRHQAEEWLGETIDPGDFADPDLWERVRVAWETSYYEERYGR